MSEKYIRIQDAIDAFNRIKNTLKNPETAHYDTLMFYEIEDVLEDVESADVVPVVQGEWKGKEVIHKRCIEEWQSARCSACGKYHTTPYMYYFDDFKFCPNCGADMRGEQE